ncbi:MAG: cache domain-containing protein [Desulfobacteraceae bacterium]|jgi:signal transduction histidine kinase
MKTIVISLLALFVYVLILAPCVSSQESEELSPFAIKAKAIVEAAHSFVGAHSDDLYAVQKALENDPRFFGHEKKLYVFVHCYNATREEAICCAQGVRPELVGKNMWHLRTPNRRQLFHEITQMIGTNGKGWIEYEWLNPYTKTIQTKRSYMMGIVLKDRRKAWVGCGFWKEK